MMLPKLTIIKWHTGIPSEEGRYLVRIYSGAVDTDYFDSRNWWHKYHMPNVMMWSKLSELEDSLTDVTAVDTLSHSITQASESMSKFKDEMSKLNMEELNDE